MKIHVLELTFFNHQISICKMNNHQIKMGRQAIKHHIIDLLILNLETKIYFYKSVV